MKKSKPKLRIDKAIKRPGALTRRAKAAGMSISEYASKHRHDSGLAGQQSRFYFTLRRIASKRKKK